MFKFLGISIVHQFDLSHKQLNTWIQINLGWGFTIMFCVYTCSKTSGGHLNPAISLMFYTIGKLPLAHVLYYIIAQVLGAFVDQTYHVLGNARIVAGPNGTASLFTSMPAPHLSNTIAFWDQFVGTGFLALFACVIIDKRNEIPSYMHALLFGLLVAMIGMAFGMNLGYPINPARDFAPRVFAAMIGYGWEVFSYHNYYFWIPILAPCFGAIAAAWSYFIFVGFQIPDQPPSYMKENKSDADEILHKDEKKPNKADEYECKRV
ncbi:channel protein, MIP family [Onchocerca flexuosa]|uniref:Channel protein, MIP family n=1 Tax=Onchocerca flexuosa TaxID=387005 RepID=A0A238BXR0_9BILA|nr:channel protein, MIP family [Onchocerca flexuosa]